MCGGGGGSGDALDVFVEVFVNIVLFYWHLDGSSYVARIGFSREDLDAPNINNVTLSVGRSTMVMCAG